MSDIVRVVLPASAAKNDDRLAFIFYNAGSIYDEKVLSDLANA